MEIIWGFEDTLQSLQEPHKPPDHTGGRKKKEHCSKHTKLLSCSQMCLAHWDGDISPVVYVSVLDKVSFFLIPPHPVLQLPRASLHPMVTTPLLIGLPGRQSALSWPRTQQGAWHTATLVAIDETGSLCMVTVCQRAETCAFFRENPMWVPLGWKSHDWRFREILSNKWS